MYQNDVPGQMSSHNNIAQQQKAYAAASQQSVAPQQPVAIRSIQEIAQRLHSLRDLTNRTGNVADRLTGPVPCDAQATQGVSAPPSALADQMSLLYSAACSIENELRESVERLERFI